MRVSIDLTEDNAEILLYAAIGEEEYYNLIVCISPYVDWDSYVYALAEFILSPSDSKSRLLALRG